MNYFVRQCVCIIGLLVVGNFNSNSLNPAEIKANLRNISNQNGIINLANDTFTPHRDGYLGEGNYGVVWKGSLRSEPQPVALKITAHSLPFVTEFDMLIELKTYFNGTTEKITFSSLHGFGLVLGKHYGLALTLCDKTIEEFIKKNGPLSPANLLRVFYHAVNALEHIQAHDIIHQDIEPNNFMFNIGRNKVVLIDFNFSVFENNQNIIGQNRMYCSIIRHLKKLESCMDDMISLFYVMLHYTGVKLPWQDNFINKTDLELATAKNQYDSIFLLCKKTGPPAVQKVFEQYYKDVMLKVANISNIDTDLRRPKTDKMKKYILDGIEALVSNRNPDFYWGKDEKNDKNRKVSSPVHGVKQHRNQTIPAYIPILPNLDLPWPDSNPTPIIFTQNTCTFDSIMTIFAALYKDNKEVAKLIDPSEKRFEKLIVKLFSTKKLYKMIEKRGELLYKMFPHKVIYDEQNVKVVKTQMSMASVILSLYDHSDIVYSAREYDVCKKCKIRREKYTYSMLPLKKLKNWFYVVQNTQKCIDNIQWTISDCICERCKTKMELDVEFNSVVLINMRAQIAAQYGFADRFVYAPIEKREITKTIKLNGKQYDFRGVVEDRVGFGNNPNHVLAHVIRNNGQWEAYDGSFPTEFYNSPDAFTPDLFVYAISDGKL